MSNNLIWVNLDQIYTFDMQVPSLHVASCEAQGIGVGLGASVG